MSALTKIFVVLLVVMSLLLTSGLVVFVNKVDVYHEQSKKATEALDRERVARQNADAQALALVGERDRAIEEAASRALALRTALDAATQQIAARDKDVQEATAAKAAADAERAVMAQTLASAQKAVEVNQTTIADLRKASDELERKYTESMVGNSDLTNRMDTVNAQLRKSREDIVALNEEIRGLRDRVAGGGGGGAVGGRPAGPGVMAPGNPNNPNLAVAPQGGAAAGGAANIRGVVRDRRNIGGVEYATISIGSSDNVTRGMKFKVLDRTRTQFLGYLTVDAVEANQATGHLQGPNLAAVNAGSEVLTNWQ